MAEVLQLYDGSSFIDLLTGDLILEYEGLSIKSGRDRMWETINLVSGSSDAAVRTAQENVDKFIEKARLFDANQVKADPIWWYWQSEGESAKRAVVFDGETELLSRGPFNTAIRPGNGSTLRLTLKRFHEWEAASVTNKTASSLSALGGISPIGIIGGSSPGRITNMRLTTGVPDTITRYWAGIQPYHNGSVAYVPLWELENGTLLTDASVVGDAGASGGNLVRVSFSTFSGMAPRVHIKPSDITGTNFDAFAGRFLVLLRCRVNAGTTEVAVQLRDGWGGQIESTETIVSTQYISGQTPWRLIELGEIQIPTTGDREGIATDVTGVIANSSVAIWAERISGSGTLDIDAIGLCPSEHMISVFYGGTVPNLGGPLMFTSPIDEQYAVMDIGGVWGHTEYSFTNWFYPIIGGHLVLFGEDNGSSKLGKTLDFDMDIYPRWKTFRT